MKLQDHLTNGLQALERQFRKNELAYLALTQKPEHVLRDRLAFELHQTLQKRDASLCVCREWRRVDLAILKGDTPKLLLEAKAFYTFDLLHEKVLEKYLGRDGHVMNDICKATDTAAKHVGDGKNARPETYALVLATETPETPSIRFRQSIKYFNCIKKYSPKPIPFGDATNIVCDRLDKLDIVGSWKIMAGKAFDVNVELFAWLLRSRRG